MATRVTGGPGRASRGQVIGPLVKYLVLAFFAAVTLYPLLLIISTAFKDPLDVTLDPFTLFSSFRFENLHDAWTLGGFGANFLNTVKITVPTVLGVLALSVLAGFVPSSGAELQTARKDLLRAPTEYQVDFPSPKVMEVS